MTVTSTGIRAGVAVAVGAALLISIALAMDGGATGSSTNVRESLAAVVADEPDLPIVVPTRWRDDWGTFEVGSWSSLDDEVVKATYRILPAEPSSEWAVGLCVAAANADEIIERFESTRNDARAAPPCGVAEDVLGERVVDGMRVVVTDIGSRSAPGDWTALSLTANWESVNWIDDVHARP